MKSQSSIARVANSRSCTATELTAPAKREQPLIAAIESTGRNLADLHSCLHQLSMQLVPVRSVRPSEANDSCAANPSPSNLADMVRGINNSISIAVSTIKSLQEELDV